MKLRVLSGDSSLRAHIRSCSAIALENVQQFLARDLGQPVYERHIGRSTVKHLVAREEP